MKQVFLRGILTGSVAGLGIDLFMGWFTEWQMTLQQHLLGLAGGFCFGILLGLSMMLLLLFLRLVDRQSGWRLAPLLEHSEPGPLGLLVGLLLTFPAAGTGGLAAGIGTFQLLQWLYQKFPSDWNFMLSMLTGLVTIPITALIGMAVGATGGAALGTGIVGLLRGLSGKR